MIRNSYSLLLKMGSNPPIKDMLDHKVSEHGVSHGLSEAGYDIRIKQSIRFKRLFGLLPMVKVDNQQWKFGRFALASAMEEFDMPTDLVGIVHDKSTWARKGLSVFNTVIEPGWKGFLTLELVFQDKDVFIPAGAGIAQVVFHETTNHISYTGKYQGQADEPVPARQSV